MADGASANPGDPPSPASARSGQRKHVPDWLNSPIWSAPPPPARHRALSPPRPPPPPPPPTQPAPPPPPPARSGGGGGSDDGSDGDDEGAASSSRPHLVPEFTVAVSFSSSSSSDRAGDFSFLIACSRSFSDLAARNCSWAGRWWIWLSCGGSRARACPTPPACAPSSGRYGGIVLPSSYFTTLITSLYFTVCHHARVKWVLRILGFRFVTAHGCCPCIGFICFLESRRQPINDGI